MTVRIRVLGVPVDCVTMETATEIATQWIRNQEQGQILAVNPEKVIKAQSDPKVLALLESARLLIPDGIGVVLAARWLGNARFGRVAGADLMPALCDMAAANGYSVFLYGASEAVNKGACDELQRRFPDLIIAGRQNGFLPANEMPELIATINAKKPDLVFVALGSPRQELWMQDYMSELNAHVFQGVGGTFDVLAGEVRRAPALFRRLNLEWLYRLLADPRRLLRQSALPRFFIQVLKARFSRTNS